MPPEPLASAEEVVQEAWVSVLAGRHRFQGRSSQGPGTSGPGPLSQDTLRARRPLGALPSLRGGDSEDAHQRVEGRERVALAILVMLPAR